jgi:ABC-type transporter Mla subunit MlaD
MRRILSVAAVLLVAGALVALVGGAAGSSGGGYQVRAIFDDASSVIPGEQVRIAGVTVGSVKSLDVTPDEKAAIVLSITTPGFEDFRADATCSIRPQSLIGEMFVECAPTQPRPAGAPEPPPLGFTPSSQNPGNSSDVARQRYLRVQNTSTPVDLDLIQNTLRLPYTQRLSLILNELGTGLAGRGSDLQAVIQRADPALQETDKVLSLVAAQNRALAALAVDSDTILAPLARDRAHVADFVVAAGTTAEATAERRAALEQDIAKLPAFLQALVPNMQRLGALADAATPTLQDLHVAAPDINRAVISLGPFATAALPAFQSLGAAAVLGTPALRNALPVLRQLRQTSSTLKPVLANLAPLLESLQSTGGIERVMDYLFYQTAAINGFDSIGHYLRAGLIVNTCSSYAITPASGCSANFPPGASKAQSAAAISGPRDETLLRTLAVLRGANPLTLLAPRGRTPRRPTSRRRTRPGVHVPAAPVAPVAAPAPSRGVSPDGSSTTPSPSSTAPPSSGTPAGNAPAPPAAPSNPLSALLDYLLGGGSR